MCIIMLLVRGLPVVDNANTALVQFGLQIRLIKACTEGHFMLPHAIQMDLEYTDTENSLEPICIRKYVSDYNSIMLMSDTSRLSIFN